MAEPPLPLVNASSGTHQPLQSLEEQLSSLRATLDAKTPRKTPAAARVHTNTKAGNLASSSAAFKEMVVEAAEHAWNMLSLSNLQSLNILRSVQAHANRIYSPTELHSD
ncbi:hypothetical protein BDQ17DRAFT_1426895 [Cyathus striatus]|nr:hypothetical protein BDQ17DRAFT_1426895 [Cyathus striatus]